MANQTKTGKAFEYALIHELEEKLSRFTPLTIIKDQLYQTSEGYFNSFNKTERQEYQLSASFAVNLLIDIEPRLSHDLNQNDSLQISLAKDSAGEKGDVRDLVMLRAPQKWEIGISAKNNHSALKHSRLSKDIDFGEKWLGYPCSESYFKAIQPVFSKLQDFKNAGVNWKDVDDKIGSVYKPLLEAFKNEMMALHSQYSDVPEKLLTYLIGTHDFYKAIKRKYQVEVQAFNLHGKLNQPFGEILPKMVAGQMMMPTKIEDISFKKTTDTTLILTMDQGWIVSFRLHSASSKVETSLKFDINLLKLPNSVFIHKMIIKEGGNT